ncbi:protein LOL1-like isoform X1 [Rutidosis leptorrhynchoides]|uniref:protein LOL1-like isoform X1 n=1 Tax=Rutidosis leptorrhynchoides TaxID=125765 RepID=UPI003A990652
MCSFFLTLFLNLHTLFHETVNISSLSQIFLIFLGKFCSESQLVCSGCRNLLLYPVGATSVCCAICNAVTPVPPPGTEMAQLVCGNCHTLLMYIRGATSVQCSCCHTINLALEANQVAHVNCGYCRTLLIYQYGARSVKCAVCQFVTSVGASTSATEQKFSI